MPWQQSGQSFLPPECVGSQLLVSTSQPACLIELGRDGGRKGGREEGRKEGREGGKEGGGVRDMIVLAPLPPYCSVLTVEVWLSTVCLVLP